MDSEWISSNPAQLVTSTDTQQFVGDDGISNRLVASSDALGSQITFTPDAPIDLEAFEEIRFWIRSSRQANGSSQHPFYLEFAYQDSGDAPEEEHRWLVPVNRSNTWEERRIGVENDRRSAVTGFQLRCLTNLPFTCNIDDLLTVREDMLLDLEQALLQQIDTQGIQLIRDDIPLSQAASPGDVQLVLPFTPDFAVDNRILVQGGSEGDEIHTVIGVTHDSAGDSTTLELDPESPLRGVLAADIATVSITVPSIVETSSVVTSPPSPSVVLTLLDVQEDLERTGYALQRDSFRQRGDLTVCSTRAAARAYLVEYQLVVLAPQRQQQLAIYRWLLQRLSIDIGLPINGSNAPVWVLPPLEADDRQLGILTTVRVRIGTRLETAQRQEQPWAQQVGIYTAQTNAPLEQEGIVLNFQNLSTG
ncbi:hypothetical protein N836_33215 [Leptolyngbya sp. Heron Island J]|nr:hypothetical protein N836_33215 [Leptolyngbya sp. Heron Island J]